MIYLVLFQDKPSTSKKCCREISQEQKKTMKAQRLQQRIIGTEKLAKTSE